MVRRPPIIYNLFPTLAGPLSDWSGHAERARGMGFNWLLLNPVNYPGFSGSLYAIKHHDRLHPGLETATGGSGLDGLGPLVRKASEMDVSMMIDLVINHTARDCPLVASRPGWYRRDAEGELLSPSAIDPANADHATVWGDLAEVDNEGAVDREGLWRFWENLVSRWMDLGFAGFRCDAAYKVPAALWRRLIEHAKRRDPDSVFLAETLGCRLAETEALADAGFDYFYNSSKWWDFAEPWCLEQHEQFRGVASSISFPESHDTPRLAAESGGSEAVQRQRYAFAAAFSEGVQTTVGYEFGFRRRLDVVKTRPWDWEEPAFDISRFLGRVNELKRRHPLLRTEGVLAPIPLEGDDVIALRRWSDEAGTHRGVILVNRNETEEQEVRLDPSDLPVPARLYRPCVDDASPAGLAVPPAVRLGPAEVALIMEAL
jgi:starch synthase (maltosyl-transferring)